MRVFHLSHNDLDGYSCQLISKRYFDQIHCYNSGYGAEVTAKLNQIRDNASMFSVKEPKLILITDLNITKDECKLVVKIKDQLEFVGHKVEICLLDHHKTGEAQAKAYDWYFLDNERSATKITYDWCKARFADHKSNSDEVLAEFVECVNAYDIWLTDQKERFEFGKVLNRLLMDSREISTLLFPAQDTSYRHSVLENSLEFIDGYRYIDLDDNLIRIKKSFLSIGRNHDTIDNLAAQLVVELINKNRERFTIEYGEFRGVLTYQIGNTSVLGNSFLEANDDYDFFMDINRNGNISLRADGKVDVSAIAAKLFGGGGHANAAGGKMLGFKESFTYDQVRDQITARMN